MSFTGKKNMGKNSIGNTDQEIEMDNGSNSMNNVRDVNNEIQG